MAIKSIEKLKNIRNKTVFVTIDFNVPLYRGKILDDFKIIKSLPTINYLLKAGARIVLISHLGNPTKPTKELSLLPVARLLAKLLGKPVKLIKTISDYNNQSDQIVLLENIRFDSREKKGSREFAKELASQADYLVFEAFASGHRHDTSIYLLPDYLPTYGGFQFFAEIKNLNLLLNHPKKLVAVIGGAKVSTKLALLKKIIYKADYVLLGGGLANTYLAALGQKIGQSITEPKMYAVCRKINKAKLILPIDLLVQRHGEYILVNNNQVGDHDKIVDLGPATIDYYSKILQQAKLIVWNGPLGLIEEKPSARATKELALRIASCSAKQIVGGGETVQVIRELNLEKYFYFVSTGGGAMLKYLEQGSLPIINKLNR